MSTRRKRPVAPKPPLPSHLLFPSSPEDIEELKRLGVGLSPDASRQLTPDEALLQRLDHLIDRLSMLLAEVRELAEQLRAAQA